MTRAILDAEGCFVGSRADLLRQEVQALQEPLRTAATHWVQALMEGRLPMLDRVVETDDLEEINALAAELRRRFRVVVVLGTGGSSLGGASLTALARDAFGRLESGVEVLFCDNIDPATWDALLTRLNPGETAVLAISKSGGTMETLAQLLVFDAWFGAHQRELADHVWVITEPKPSCLQEFAQRRGIATLDHHTGIGGRYALFSNVSLLPAAIAGVDIAAVRRGGNEVLQAFRLEMLESAPAQGAAWLVAANKHGYTQTVMMPYADRLLPFVAWFRQLWAESIGKNGLGITPLRALGTVDQHSQLQLYLDGPTDKTFTLFLPDVAGQGPRMAATPEFPALAYLAEKTLGDVMAAEQQATADTFIATGCPTRVFRLAEVDASAFGALAMHFFLETLLAASLLGVDPFDQPAVETGKIRAKAILERA